MEKNRFLFTREIKSDLKLCQVNPDNHEEVYTKRLFIGNFKLFEYRFNLTVDENNQTAKNGIVFNKKD